MNLTSSRRLLGLGAIILAALVACSRFEVGTPSFLITIGTAGIAYLLAVRELFRTSRFPRQVVLACLALCALWRIPFLMMPLGPDDDIRRYLWDGRIQRLGYNPYEVIPSDPAMAALHTPETRGLNNPEVPSPYPAGAQFFFRSVTAIHESIFAFKIAFVICDCAIVILLLGALRRSGQGEHWVLAYAWHPLLATNAVGSGHIDILGVLLLLVSALALGRRWRMIAAVAFGLAVAVKFLPIVLTPLYWRRVRIRDALVAAIVVAALYVPFLGHWRIALGSLGVFIQRFRFNDPLFSAIERVASPSVSAAVALLIGLAAAAWLRTRPETTWPAGWAWPMAASLAFAPVVYPWYLLWLVPFLGSTSTVPLMVWTVSIFPTYTIWYLRTLGREWHLPGWVLLLEYGSVAAAAAIMLFRRMARPLGQASPAEVPANYDGNDGTSKTVD